MAAIDPKFYQYLSWTYSRHVSFRECRRAYWYENVGTYCTNIDRGLKSRLWRLKDLTNTRFLLGSLVHTAISEYISQVRKARSITESELHSHLTQNVERYRNTAKDTIAEIVNGGRIQSSFFDRLSSEGRDQLSMFFRVMWPPLSRLEYSQHEKPERFPLDDMTVGVKVDLVSKSPDGRIFVIDWKTGFEDPKYDNDLQVGAYGMWALAKFKVEPSKVSTELCYLRAGKCVDCGLSDSIITKVRDIVRKEYDVFSTELRMEDNLPSPEPGKCPSCKFGSICESADLSESGS